MNFFLSFQHHFALFALGALDGLIEDALGLLLRAADLFFGNVFAVHHAHQEEHNTTYHNARDDQGDCESGVHHNLRTHLLSHRFGIE